MFIVREQAVGPELLVFHHDYSGLQIPAGTVEAGERPEHAIVREVREEAGLEDLVFEHLGTRTVTYPDDYVVIGSVCDLLAEPCVGAPVIRQMRRGGVRRLAEQNGYTQICVEQLNYDFDSPRRVGSGAEYGWVPSGILWTSETRSFYLARPERVLPDSWIVQAEQSADFDGYEFRFRWLPLTRTMPLLGLHRDWVQEYWGDLSERIAALAR